MTYYLADSSIWAWANKRTRPDITAKLAERLLEPLRWLPLTSDTGEQALQVQRQLAGRFHGHHRRPVADLLIGAVGELAGDDVVTWFFDRDLRVICEHTGQAFEAESTTGPGH